MSSPKLNLKLGQYFTTHPILKEKVFEFILNNPANILEPSIGRGDLIAFISGKNPTATFDMYEIDTNIVLLPEIQRDRVNYGDFIEQTITKTYNTIVGNPPYIKTNKRNLYVDFTEKCYNLLEADGELIFIVPSGFFKLTGASKLLDKMMTTGTFTHIFHPNDEKMFDDANIDIVVFRYCKNPTLEKKAIYNDKCLYITNNHGLITFDETECNDGTSLFKDHFTVYVGIVSGKEDVYKHPEIGNIEVLNGENKTDKYIYIENYPCNNEKINSHLLEHKPELMERGIRKFGENNWFEWGAPRNMKAIRGNMGKDCIYIYNLTRKTTVAFTGKVNYFGGGLIMLLPNKKCDLERIVAYINSPPFKNNFMFSGRFKIGHRQINNSRLPVDVL
jgi:adenine-specific DNA-methyltransferase